MVSFFTYNNWTGSSVRGKEIAEYLGTKLNIREKTVIHVKPPDLNNVLDGEWVDILDSSLLVEMLKTRPKVNAIALTEYSYGFLKLPNKVVLIPQQHINWDREKRTRKEVSVCGYIGAPSDRVRRHYAKIAEAIRKMDFITCFNYTGRQDAIDFYKSIDILVVSSLHRNEPFKSPTKMINAASFGVPSIAIPLPGYLEWEGNYTRFNDFNELNEGIAVIKNNYDILSEKMASEAEKYHISKIAGKYKAL